MSSPCYTVDMLPEHLHLLLEGAPLLALLEVSAQGPIVIYHAYGDDCDDWSLWIEPLARVRPGHRGKVHLDDWLVNHAAYVSECLSHVRWPAGG